MPKFFNTIEAQVGNFTIQNSADNKDIAFKSDNGSGGLTTYLELDGSVTRMNSKVDLRFDDNKDIQLGNGNDLNITHNGSNSEVQNQTGNLNIRSTNTDGDIKFFLDDNSGSTTQYVRMDGGINKTLFFKDTRHGDNVKALFGGGEDLEIYHDGTNSVINNTQGHLQLYNNSNDKDIVFISDDGSGGTTEYFRVDGGIAMNVVSKAMLFIDNVRADFGSSNDLRIYHNGTNSIIENVTGDLVIQNNLDDKDIIFKSDDGSGGITEYFKLDGSTTRTLVSKNLDLHDDVRLRIGTGSAEGAQDLQLYHNGSASYIEQVGTGDLIIQQSVDDKDIVFNCDDGSGDVDEYFRVDGSAEAIIISKNVQHADNVKAYFGNGIDLEIYHDGSNSYINDDGTGDLYIQTNGTNMFLRDKSSGDTFIAMNTGTADVVLKQGGNTKLATTNTGISVTGDISVSGDIKGRSIPMVIHASFDDTTSTTANRIIPLMGSIVETSVSGGYAPHFFTIPYACVLKRVIMKTVAGSQSSSFTTELKAYKNGSVTGNSSSGELTHSSSSITWNPTAHSDITYAAGDKFSLVYQKSATSKYWQDVAVTIVFTLTSYDI